jgi:hypothetical protein
MPAWALILIVLVVVAVAAAIAAVTMRQRRTTGLRDRFGPEYDRTVESRAQRRAAEAELLGRQRERAKLDIKPLPAATRLRYGEQWRVVQERFVDQPIEALASADRLLHQVMAERGYPVGDFATQSDLISVDHPQVVEDYRVAHATYERTETGQVGTEELREALLRYRSLFDELLRPDQEDEQGDEQPRSGRDGSSAGEPVLGEPGPGNTPAADAATDETTANVRPAGAEPVPAQRTTGELPSTPEADHDSR